MQSVCPKCQKAVEHEDYLFEVKCECGMRFNPYFTGETTDTHADTASDPDGFQESTSAFKDIVTFGESVSQTGEAPVITEIKAVVPQKTMAYATPSDGPKISSPPQAASPILISPTNEIPEHKTERFFLPISVVTDFDANQEDPLSPGIQLLCQKATHLNANGLCGLQWQILPDGSKIIFSAIPVHCTPR